MFYLYIYLDPRKPGEFIYDDLKFDFEPIYVGKGKNNRAYYHLNETARGNLKNIKFNKIKAGLSFLKNDIEEFKKYIIFPFISEDENFILGKENEFIKKIGTIKKVENINKKGPLCNLCEGGINPPILRGKKNPMYGKSIFEIWDKNGENVEEKKKKWMNSLLKRNEKFTPWWKTENRDKISKSISQKTSGKNNMKYRSSKEKLEEIEKRRLESFKKTVENRSPEEKLQIANIHREAINKYWGNISEERLKEIGESIKNSLYNYYLDSDKDPIKKEKLKERAKKSVITRQGTEEKQKYFCDLMKKSNYMNNTELSYYEFFLKKHGEKYVENLKKKLSQNNSGNKNNMYGKGYKLKGSKNGRARNIIVHFPSGEKYLCFGTFKKFCKEILSKFKPMPHRKYPFEKEIDGWFFSRIDDLSKIDFKNYIKYE